MTTLISTILWGSLGPLLGFAPPAADPPPDERAGTASTPPAVAAPAPTVAPTPGDTAALGERLDVEYDLPFASEELSLSEALNAALAENIDLSTALMDVEVSESSVMSAQGAFDVVITAGIAGSIQESTPRGSVFIFNTGTRTLSGYFGVGRQLETGGRIDLRFDVQRSLSDQPLSFIQPELGSTTLAAYQITPRLTFTHPLLRGVGIKYNKVQIERARLAATQAESQAQVTAQNTVRDLVSAYWDLLFASRDLANKHRSVELAKAQLERTRAQVNAGRLAPVDLKAVEQALATREQEVILAENTLLDASLNMRVLLGEDFEDRVMLGLDPSTDPERFEPEPVDIDASVDMAMQANPQVRQLQLALSSRRLDELEAANQRLVQLDFTGTFSPQGRSVDTAADPSTGTPQQRGSWGEAFRNFVNEDVGRDGIFAEYTVSGALDLTWNVQNRTARGNHQRTLAEVRKAEAALEQVRQTITTSVIRAANGIRSAQKRMEVAEISVELAEENLRAEEARFNVGRSTSYDVLDRIDALQTAQSSALSARIEYLKARAQLQALTGEILPAYGLEMRQAG